MPLLFSILEHYNLLSKQPNYACGLFFSFFFFQLVFVVMSWARAIMSISKKAWTFPRRPYYYILYCQKLIESPKTVKQKEERNIPGPRDNLEGKSCLADSFLVSWPCLWDNLEGKSCLAGSSLILWPCHRPGMSWRLLTHIHVTIIYKRIWFLLSTFDRIDMITLMDWLVYPKRYAEDLTYLEIECL